MKRPATQIENRSYKLTDIGYDRSGFLISCFGVCCALLGENR